MVVTRGGLRLVFDQALDGAAWPGSLSGCDAHFGDTWCGPQGLLGRLETELGLVAPPRRGIERAVEHVHRLGAREGYWSKSFETEPLATASRLLADRDLLALSGWNGQSIGGRLDALWRATADALPGVPDRLRRIIGLLPKRSVDISSIVVLEAVDLLPPLWQQLFSALAASGIEIAHRAVITTRLAQMYGVLQAVTTPVMQVVFAQSMRCHSTT